MTLKTERHHHNGSAHAAFNACIGHVHGLSYGRSWTFTTTTAPMLPRLRYHLNLVFNTISRALLCLITRSYSLNIAVYQVDPCSSQQYVLIQEFVGDPMLPTAPLPLCPFFFLRFAHSLSSLRVIFLVKSSSLEVSEQPFFDVLMSKFNLGPTPLWHGAASPLYMPPPLLF